MYDSSGKLSVQGQQQYAGTVATGRFLSIDQRSGKPKETAAIYQIAAVVSHRNVFVIERFTRYRGLC